jgi:hypothetical protein
MLKNSFFLACLLGLLCATQIGCDKSAPVSLYFDETGCSNPWDSYYEADSFSLAALEQSIYRMLQDYQIQDATVRFDFDSTKIQLCLACHCTTGRIVVVHTTQANRLALRRLDFYP